MQQIADWLETLGMSEYAERFAESDIDTSVLRDLTDQDLKELDISLGHRRKMLRAIAELAGVAPTSLQPALTEPKPQDTAERRQVTVMFSDLVGSTAMSARLDAEDLREVISAYEKCVTNTVRRFSGFVAKYIGDGVLVYFGYPQAHEDGTSIHRFSASERQHMQWTRLRHRGPVHWTCCRRRCSRSIAASLSSGPQLWACPRFMNGQKWRKRVV
jgi:class 3 adenylate cyclase